MGHKTMALVGTMLATMTIGIATPAFAATQAAPRVAQSRSSQPQGVGQDTVGDSGLGQDGDLLGGATGFLPISDQVEFCVNRDLPPEAACQDIASHIGGGGGGVGALGEN